MSGSAVRVVLADDHPVFRRGLASVLSDDDRVELVAQAADGHEAIAAVREQAPDVVVMDLKMPGLSGIEATRRLSEESPEVGVLVLTMLDDDDSVVAALRAGAHGYLVKESDDEEIVRAIEAVHRRELLLGAGVASRVLAFFAGEAALGPAAGDPFPELTAREREVLDLVARGLDNAEIERRLVVSPKTVRNHVHAIYAKLRVTGRPEAIVRAREAGLGGGKNQPG